MSEDLGVVDALAQLSFLIQATLERRVTRYDLSMAQTRLLGVLRDRRPTMNELARLLELEKSSVTGLVDRAERRGLVERAPSSTDRRAVRVGLTGEGQALVGAIADGFGADLALLLEPLPPGERAALSALAGRILVGHAEAHGIDLFATETVS